MPGPIFLLFEGVCRWQNLQTHPRSLEKCFVRWLFSESRQRQWDPCCPQWNSYFQREASSNEQMRKRVGGKIQEPDRLMHNLRTAVQGPQHLLQWSGSRRGRQHLFRHGWRYERNSFPMEFSLLLGAPLSEHTGLCCGWSCGAAGDPLLCRCWHHHYSTEHWTSATKTSAKAKITLWICIPWQLLTEACVVVNRFCNLPNIFQR